MFLSVESAVFKPHLFLVLFVCLRASKGLLEHSGAYGMRSMEGLGHGRSSTGYAKEEGEAILKTSSTNPSSSTRPAKLQLDRAEKSKSNPKNVASPLTFL
ncbi:unnamed protein product [Microthlaspi erraticum]|uniref:Secreted protein n=1 Tax=Microthlaspi erraticum TaxID=1685480 RepID=A0A6D2J824_9BRAS|nr:unnamed protein product [Microthlaspi erraticum]